MNRKPKIPEINGHYEKVKEDITRYFYVNDNKPSGAPNAFVVSESEAKGFLDNELYL
jgi:hypothetical protein